MLQNAIPIGSGQVICKEECKNAKGSATRAGMNFCYHYISAEAVQTVQLCSRMCFIFNLRKR